MSSRNLVRHHSGVWIRAGQHTRHDSFIVGENLFDDQYRLTSLNWFRPRVVIDVGAHIGTASIAFARLWPEATIIAIEPDSSAWECLEANLAELPNTTELIRSAAVANGDTVSFHATVPSHESRISPEGASVPAVPLGPIIAAQHGPMLLKLDCEGAEHELLRLPEIAQIALVLGEWHSEPLWIDTRAYLVRKGMVISPLSRTMFSGVWK